ncbi:MAG: rpoZ [Candidatus Brocadiaceae bacterium]|nr:rpoZ [Candidatus Brocadiaceae bacterium]
MFKLDYKKIDELANRVGGALRLTSLIVSRARQIVKKSPILVETESDDPVQIAFQELMEGKIRLREEYEQVPVVPVSQENKEKTL